MNHLTYIAGIFMFWAVMSFLFMKYADKTEYDTNIALAGIFMMGIFWPPFTIFAICILIVGVIYYIFKYWVSLILRLANLDKS